MIRRLSCAFVFIFCLGGCGEQDAPGTNLRTLQLGDGSEITHPWDEAGPLPASNDWVSVEVAGYLLSENTDGEGFSWTWTFTLGLKNPDIELVAVSDVSDIVAARLVAPGQGVFNDGKWLAQSRSIPVSGFHLPWLFQDGENVRILRFSIAARQGETRILYQPVVFTHAGKKSLLSIARGEIEGI
ncbi:MAG: hypothetical protein HKN59_06850 [Gammaproteobacteria bacterium]|nr:hypothetical protein [Gammaproteobacteria bacterium]